MAVDGPLDVVQYDIFSYGFMAWVVLGPILDAAGVMSAPHHYGAALGNYYSGHLAGAIEGFSRVEWDEVRQLLCWHYLPPVVALFPTSKLYLVSCCSMVPVVVRLCALLSLGRW